MNDDESEAFSVENLWPIIVAVLLTLARNEHSQAKFKHVDQKTCNVDDYAIFHYPAKEKLC